MTLNLLLPYENKWVAWNPTKTKILASGNSYKEVDLKLKKKKIEEVILSFILPFDKSHSPNGKRLN